MPTQPTETSLLIKQRDRLQAQLDESRRTVAMLIKQLADRPMLVVPEPASRETTLASYRAIMEGSQ